MSEMVETQAILSTASPASLVLIDELGRGTSTYDGFGLAWAVAGHIAGHIQCPALFTTHYTQLTELAHVQQNVSNYHVSALVGDEKLTLLYQLQPGVCDKSFGIDVAKIANFPDHVVQEAKRRINLMEGIKDDANMTSDQRREIVNEGEKLISEILEKVKQLETVSDDNELVSKFTALKEEITSSSNKYVKCFM